MLGLLFAGVVTTAVGYLIAKKAYAPAILMFGGITLMILGVAFGLGHFLPPKQSTGIMFFDLFDAIRRMFSTRMAGLGLTIMAIAGFSQYMDQLKASEALFSVVGAPLKYIKNPYALLMGCFLVSQFISLFVPSAAGCSLLLMVTMYPIMIRCGISRLSACAVIGSARCLSMGPASPNAVFACGQIDMNTAEYFLQYLGKLAVPMIIILGITHFFVQRYFDKKEGPDLEGMKLLEESKVHEGEKTPPRFYALLPILPLAIIICSSPLFTNYVGWPPIKLNVGTAMFLSIIVSMLVHLVWTRNFYGMLASLRGVFDRMGKQFALVVCLIVCGEIFARGLVTVGSIATLIDMAKNAGLGPLPLIIVAGAIIFVFALLMGSGNAPFFSFGVLVPEIAKVMEFAPVLMLVPLDLYSGLGRTVSPVFGSTIAIAGIAGVSPFTIAKREIIPMAILAVAMPFLLKLLFPL